MKLVLIAGARPNFIKIAPIIWEFKRRQKEATNFKHEYFFIHTGQHFDPAMSDAFLNDLEIESPHVNLGVGSGSHTTQTARIMLRLEKSLKEINPDVVVVVGDVNSTLAGALTAAKMGIKLAHVEAGLRSFDRRMPEELNRIVTDHLSDYLFTPSREANENLMAEGISREKIYFVGNVIIDTLIHCRSRAEALRIYEKFGLKKKGYAVLTLHRPSNVDDLHQLREILMACCEIARHIPLVFPVHPRTKKMMTCSQLAEKTLPSTFILTSPLSYLEFLSLMGGACFVLTDSGGIQEETTFLQIPCLTVRENTERLITVREGTNCLVGTRAEKIIEAARKIIGGFRPKASSPPELWDGQTARRILDILLN